jgi:signal transduction histidine kinase
MSEQNHPSSLSTLFEFRKNRFYKYIISFSIICVVTFIQILIWPLIEPAPYLLYYPAIILASLYGDGNTAIIGSILLGQYYFVLPYESLHVHWPNDYVRILTFLIAAVMIRSIIRQQTTDKLKAQSAVELLLKREKDLEAEKSTREKFVSLLSHDLKTPLTAAKLNAELLERKKNDPEAIANILSRQKNNLNRIESMIQDLLDANSIRAGKPPPIEIRPCEMSKIIHSTIQELLPIYGDRFVVKNVPEYQGHWSCEGIRRILENLCSNAVKYGADGEKITICCEQIDNGLILSVNNKGPVIPEDVQSSLFNPYERWSTAQGKKGWGLGLTLVKGLTEVQGGSVSVESSREQGTTFSIYLPRDARIGLA